LLKKNLLKNQARINKRQDSIKNIKNKKMFTMNVLILAQYFPPDFNGASTRASNIAKALKMQGCKVVIVSAFPHYPGGNIPDKYQRKILVEEEIEGMKVIRTWVPKLPHSSNFKRVLIHFSFFFIIIICNPKSWESRLNFCLKC